MVTVAPRWPAFDVTFLDTGEQVQVQARDADVCRLEDITGKSWADLVAEKRWGTWMRLAWVILRRQKDPRAVDNFNEFIDGIDIDFVATEADPKAEGGTGSDLAPPTGESPSSP